MAGVITGVGQLFAIALIARALLSWFNLDPRSPLIQALHSVTEPIVEPIRRVMPRLGMIDLSVLVAIFAVEIIAAVLAALVDGNLP